MRPVLRWLAEATDETAILFLRSGTQRILMAGAAAPNRPEAAALPPIGERAPLGTGASGLAILAHLPEVEATTVLRSSRGKSPSRTRLAEIRNDGYAITHSGNRRGANGVAAPILDPADHYPLGSIAVAGPTERAPEPTLRAHATHLRNACAQLAPHMAAMFGPHASTPQRTLDVRPRDFLEDAH